MECEDERIRVLVSDYVFQCASPIEQNITEAKLHLIGFIEESSNVSALFVNSIVDVNGVKTFRHGSLHRCHHETGTMWWIPEIPFSATATDSPVVAPSMEPMRSRVVDEIMI
jgi:hypothetical protein